MLANPAAQLSLERTGKNLVIRRLCVIRRQTFLWGDGVEGGFSWAVRKWKQQMLTTLYNHLAVNGRRKVGQYQKGNYVEGMEETGSRCSAAGRAMQQEKPRSSIAQTQWACVQDLESSFQGSEPDLSSAICQLSLSFPIFGMGDSDNRLYPIEQP